MADKYGCYSHYLALHAGLTYAVIMYSLSRYMCKMVQVDKLAVQLWVQVGFKAGYQTVSLGFWKFAVDM